MNPTDTNNRPLVVGTDYYLSEHSPRVEYKGLENHPLLGWRLKFTDLNETGIVLRPRNFRPTRLEGQAGGKRKSKNKSKKKKTKRRKSRRRKTRRR